MNISSFTKSFRLGEHDKCFLDVYPIGEHAHSQCGMMVLAYLMSSDKDYTKHKVELRKRDNIVALITYHFDDSEINPYWRDAEILFSWEESESNE